MYWKCPDLHIPILSSLFLCIFVCLLGHLSCVQLFSGPMDCSSPGSSVHGILQSRILEWVAMSPFRGSSGPRDRIHLSCVTCIADGEALVQLCISIISSLLTMYWKSPGPAGFIFYSFCYYWENCLKSAPVGDCRFAYFCTSLSLLMDAYTFKTDLSSLFFQLEGKAFIIWEWHTGNLSYKLCLKRYSFQLSLMLILML